MKKIFSLFVLSTLFISLFGQELTEVQKAAATASQVITAAPEEAPKVEEPKYWDNSLKNQINVGQTALFNWAAGGDNTVSMQGFIDGNANYKKDAMFWTNRLQLDYGFIYASSKPILQKSADRIYLESKWGYQAVKNLYASANFDFKSQFSNTFNYPVPKKKADGSDFGENETPKRADWLEAKSLKSGLLSPAYTNLALGVDYKPTKWLSINFAPLTGGFVIVHKEELRKAYGMNLKEEFKTMDTSLQEYKDAVANGTAFRASRFEFGAQLKTDIAVIVNDNLKYSTQLVLFSNYLDKPQELRINWDNRFDWKLAKYFSFTILTNLVYDPKVIIQTEKDIEQGLPGKRRVQFRESLAFGFTYTIASKK